MLTAMETYNPTTELFPRSEDTALPSQRHENQKSRLMRNVTLLVCEDTIRCHITSE